MGALTEALDRYGALLISNRDYCNQFNCEAWLGVLKDAGVRISMDGRGHWIDNRFIEQLWRSLKYEAVYLEELAGGHHASRDRLMAGPLQQSVPALGAVRTGARGGPLRGAAGDAEDGRVSAAVHAPVAPLPARERRRQPAIRLTTPTERKDNAASNEGDEPTRKQSFALPSNFPNEPDQFTLKIQVHHRSTRDVEQRPL